MSRAPTDAIAAARGEWMPIATVPRDRKPVWLLHEDGRMMDAVWHTEDDREGNDAVWVCRLSGLCYLDSDWSFTHWQPLPSLPEPPQ